MEEISPSASASDDAHDEPMKILVLETSRNDTFKHGANWNKMLGGFCGDMVVSRQSWLDT